MSKKRIAPGEVKPAIKEKVAQLNELLQVAAADGLIIVIRPDNGTITPDSPLACTKSIMAINYTGLLV